MQVSQFKELIRKLALKALSATDPKAWDASLWNLYGTKAESGEIVNEYTAMTYSAFWNGVALISGTIGSLPLHLMQKRGSSKRIADERKLYSIMHDQWNPYMTAMAGRETMAAHMITWGNSYAEKVYNYSGDIVELWPISPNRVQILKKEGEIVYEVQIPPSSPIIIPRERMLHIPGLGFDGIQGYSVVSLARKSLGLGMAMETFSSRFYGAGTNVGGIITYPGTIKDKKEFREATSEVYGGLGKSHQLMLLEEGMKYEKVGMAPEDSQFIESKQHHITDVARWLNLPPHKLKDLTRSSFCLPAEVEVYTQDGPIPIANVNKGAKVWSLSKQGWELSPVLRSEITGFDEIFTIKTTNRTIQCNEKHPILIREKIGSEQGGTWINSWRRAGDLKKGDTIVVLKNLPEVNVIKKRTDGSDVSVELMEFCGLLIGDGNIIKVDGRPSSVCIARADHATYMDYYKSIMIKLFNAGGYQSPNNENHHMAKLSDTQADEIRERGKNIITNMDIARKYNVNICAIQNIIHRKYCWQHPQASLNETQVREIKNIVATRETSKSIAADYGVSFDTVNKILAGKIRSGNRKVTPLRNVFLRDGYNSTKFSSALAAQELVDLGFSGVAHTKKVPDWVFSVSDDLKLGFLRGFLDADGSVDKLGRISFSSCNRLMLSQMRHLCMGLGIPVTNLRYHEGTSVLPNGKIHAYKQWYITCSDPGSNRRIGSHTAEYITRMNNAKPFGKKDRNYPKFGGTGFDTQGCALARIVDIQKGTILQPVYDLAVQDTHSFIANGVVVHNSNIESEQISFVMDSILPWLIRLEQNYNMQLLSPSDRNMSGYGRYYFKHALEGLLRGDAESRAKLYQALFAVGALSPNDIREMEDKDPIVGGDKYFVPLNMISLDRVDEYITSMIAKKATNLTVSNSDDEPTLRDTEGGI